MPTEYGLPRVMMTFRGKANLFIRHSERGTAYLILRDDTAPEVTERTYTSFLQIDKEEWSTENYDYLRLAFSGGPRRLKVAKIGTVATLEEFLPSQQYVKFNYGAMPEATAEENLALVQWIKDNRQNKTNPTLNGVWKWVTHIVEADYPPVIDFFTNSVTEEDATGQRTWTGQEYTAKIAGLLAGMSIMRSATSFQLREVVDAQKHELPDKLISEGKLIIVYDGEKYKLGRGVNTMQTFLFGEGQVQEMAKIRIQECMDIIREDIVTTFLDDYSGQVLNTYDNKMMFCANITHIYFKELGGMVLDPDWDNRADLDVDAIKLWMMKYDGVTVEQLDNMTETEIRQYPTDAHVFVKANVKFLDAIEDLDIAIEI